MEANKDKPGKRGRPPKEKKEPLEAPKGAGGKRLNAGRKSVQEEQKITNIFTSAVKRIFGEKDKDGNFVSEAEETEAKIRLIVDLYTFARGKIFVAEHVLGKPREVVDLQINKSPDLSELSTEDIKTLLGENE